MDEPRIIPREIHLANHGICAFAAVIAVSIAFVPMALSSKVSPSLLAVTSVSGIVAFLVITSVLQLAFEPWIDRRIAAANPGFVKKPEITRNGMPIAVDRAFWLIWSFASACALAVGLSVMHLWPPGEPTGLGELIPIASGAVTYLAISKGIWRLIKPWARVRIEEAKLALAAQ